jgi:hypothetical protein
MTAVNISASLDGNTPLWRYMSLDKLIDLLSTRELHFTPLAFFVKSDPFEGYVPAVSLEAVASIFRPKVKDSEFAFELVKEHRKSVGYELTSAEKADFQRQMDGLKTAPRDYYDAITKSISVNCWHINKGESEAMWRLYSDNGKGVAVETTLSLLAESIRVFESPFRVQIYPVKYLDFFDNTLSPRDCVVEGHTVPLLKRDSYEHEHEVRAFIVNVPKTARDAANLDSWKPYPTRIQIELIRLIKAVHISPYSKDPFPSSVTRICELFGLPKDIVHFSRLLSGHEELLDRLLL